MSVEAKCMECGDRHPLEDRVLNGRLSTSCPSCESTQYESIPTDGHITKSERERIRDAVSGVSGVGDETMDALYYKFKTLTALQSASVDELTTVKNVGTTVAQRIQDSVT